MPDDKIQKPVTANLAQRTSQQDRIDFVLSQLGLSFPDFHFKSLPIPESTGPTADPLERNPRPGERKTCTPIEMARIVLDTLTAIEGSPANGFLITVYGLNPWNAMLTITPQAKGISNARIWRAHLREIVTRLRDDFDVIYPDSDLQ